MDRQDTGQSQPSNHDTRGIDRSELNGPHLVLQTASGEARVYPLARPSTVLGRSINCDMRLAIPSIARRQCEVSLDGAMVAVRDLQPNKAPATLRNGVTIEKAILEHGDVLQVGPVQFTFLIRPEPGISTANPTISTPGKAAMRDEKIHPFELEIEADRSALTDRTASETQ